MNKKNVVQSTRILKISQDKGYACVYLNKEKIMLGARFGTPEADEAFRQLQMRRWQSPSDQGTHLALPLIISTGVGILPSCTGAGI